MLLELGLVTPQGSNPHWSNEIAVKERTINFQDKNLPLDPLLVRLQAHRTVQLQYIQFIMSSMSAWYNSINKKIFQMLFKEKLYHLHFKNSFCLIIFKTFSHLKTFWWIFYFPCSYKVLFTTLQVNYSITHLQNNIFVICFNSNASSFQFFHSSWKHITFCKSISVSWYS